MQNVIFPGRRHRTPVSIWNPVRSARDGGVLAGEYGSLLSPIEQPASLLLPAPAQDPQVLFAEGVYHYCESTPEGIFLRSAPSLREIGRTPRRHIWKAPRTGPCSKNIWAPELHTIAGRHYVYFAADDGDNAQHRMWVLASVGNDIRGPYTLIDSLDTAGWAIDGTVVQGSKGELHFIWSGWPDRTDGQQNLYISRMSSPVKLAGARQVLARPTLAWERRGMPICEGPQVLRRAHQTFVVYSASASWTADYCLGMLVHRGGDLMDPSAWTKSGQVFGRNEYAVGVGHCGFVRTPEGQDWILYHAKTRNRPGWADREVRAQTFTWDRAGHPVFGMPRPVNGAGRLRQAA